MKITTTLFGKLLTTRFWNRRKERMISIVITITCLPLLCIYILGNFAGIAIDKLHEKENEVVHSYLKKEKNKKK